MAQYHVAVAGQQRGPYTVEELRANGISPSSLVWTEGMTDWLPAGNVFELAPLLAAPAVAPPIPDRRLQQPAVVPAPAPVYPQPYSGHMVPGHPLGYTVVAPVFIPTKSVGVAFVLTFFFGPLGMLYSTVTGAVVMLIVSVLAAVVTLGLSVIVTWPICIVWGCIAASSYNNRLIGQIRV
jgi:hypothetical protein